MKEIKAFNALYQAYLLLLKMPDSGVRVRNQSALCALRDAIASETGMTAEEVQNEAESTALEQRLAA
jgi:hypothetical protein